MYSDLVKSLDYLSDLSLINRAYELSSSLHYNQFRASGEEYITHPLAVAKILASMHGDESTICAALLHDTIEDTPCTKTDIASAFGDDIAGLVDGVTKEKKDLFSSKTEREIYNSKKLILSSTNDIRVMIIKLADRLHNMSTLEYKNSKSILSNSEETMMFYVPISSILGMRDMRRKLEDFAFKYLDRKLYESALNMRDSILNYSEIGDLKNKIETYMKYTNTEGEVVLKIDGVLESYLKIKNGQDKLFTIYVITDEHLPFDEGIVKTVSKEEYDILENGIASSFNRGNIKEAFENTDLKDSLMSFNRDYIRGMEV